MSSNLWSKARRYSRVALAVFVLLAAGCQPGEPSSPDDDSDAHGTINAKVLQRTASISKPCRWMLSDAER